MQYAFLRQRKRLNEDGIIWKPLSIHCPLARRAITKIDIRMWCRQRSVSPLTERTAHRRSTKMLYEKNIEQSWGKSIMGPIYKRSGCPDRCCTGKTHALYLLSLMKAKFIMQSVEITFVPSEETNMPSWYLKTFMYIEDNSHSFWRMLWPSTNVKVCP